MSTYEGANLAWQLAGDRALIRELSEKADVLAFVEARTRTNDPVDVKAILGRDWWVGQNTRNGALSGSVIAIRKRGLVRRRVVLPALRRLLQVSKGGHDVQARFLRTLPIRDEKGPATLFVVHIPLRSTGQQEAALDALRDAWRATPGRKLLFADGNGAPRAVATHMTAPHFDGDGVMVWAWSRGWGDVDVTWRKRPHTDHKTGRLRAHG